MTRKVSCQLKTDIESGYNLSHDNSLELSDTLLRFDQLKCYRTVNAAIADQIDDNPLYLFKTATLEDRVKIFRENFPGQILYSLRANHNSCVISSLAQHGVKAFEVMSIYEVELARELCPDAEIFFMNPVKPPSSIRQAYYQFGVRSFCLGSHWELEKILQETNYAKDLKLFIRIAAAYSNDLLEVSNDVGITVEQALVLLNNVSQYTEKVGLSFYVGSQCSDPIAYHDGLNKVSSILNDLTFPLTAINIGGGFAANYAQYSTDPLEQYLKTISRYCEPFLSKAETLLIAPGRAMVADICSLIVRVIGLKGNRLYLTDGRYGGLHEYAANSVPFVASPVAIDDNKTWSTTRKALSVWGPSCDGWDRFANIECQLPDNIELGDYIEFAYAGAYSEVFRSNFNGFYRFNQARLELESN